MTKECWWCKKPFTKENPHSYEFDFIHETCADEHHADQMRKLREKAEAQGIATDELLRRGAERIFGTPPR